MRSQLTNKVIWITGASSGIGEALAYELIKHGANLILSARRTEALERVKKNCLPKSDNIRILPLDLADSHSLQGITETAIQFFGHIDILINNGGLGQRSLIYDTTLETYRQLIEVNFFGSISLTKFLLPHFVHRQQGHFVTVTSITGKFGTPLRSGYAAAKHALHGFFDSLRAEQWQNNIHVTIVCPGFIATNLSASALTGHGSPQNHLDKTSYKKKSPEWCAQRIVQAIERKKQEVYIGGKEVWGVHLKRFFPSLFSKIIRKVAVR
jgi:short-subunit dehydrogenase